MFIKTYEFDGKEYGMLNKFSIEDNIYCLFINVNDYNDFFVRKYIVVDNKEYIKKLSKEEFVKFGNLFNEKINELLNNKN